MNTIKNKPLSREYLHNLMQEANEEFVRPSMNDYIKLVREEAIKIAINGSTSLYTSIPQKFERHQFILHKLLEDNFPDCEIIFDVSNVSKNTWLEIRWGPHK